MFIGAMMLGAFLVLLGIGIGMLIAEHLPKRSRDSKGPAPVCSCGHTRAFHKPVADGKASRCNDKYGRWDACRCLSYDGPIPLETYYAPEIS